MINTTVRISNENLDELEAGIEGALLLWQRQHSRGLPVPERTQILTPTRSAIAADLKCYLRDCRTQVQKLFTPFFS